MQSAARGVKFFCRSKRILNVARDVNFGGLDWQRLIFKKTHTVTGHWCAHVVLLPKNYLVPIVIVCSLVKKQQLGGSYGAICTKQCEIKQILLCFLQVIQAIYKCLYPLNFIPGVMLNY